MIDQEFVKKCQDNKDVIVVYHYVVENLINRHFKGVIAYDLIQDQEVSNYSHVRLGIEPFENGFSYTEEYREVLTNIENGIGQSFVLEDLLRILCTKGVIPKGDYVILVFW